MNILLLWGIKKYYWVKQYYLLCIDKYLQFIEFWLFAQKGNLLSNRKKLNITVEFSIFELREVPNFISK